MSSSVSEHAGVEAVVRAIAEFREAELQLWRRAGVELELTFSAMLALAAILRGEASGTPLRQVDVRNQLLLSAAAVSSTVDELERRGFVRREADPADRRATLLRAGDHAGPIAQKLEDANTVVRQRARQLPPEALATVVALIQDAQHYGDSAYPNP